MISFVNLVHQLGLNWEIDASSEQIFLSKPLSKDTSVRYIVSAPSKVHEYAKNNAKQRKKDYDKNRYLASQNKRLREHGVDV